MTLASARRRYVSDAVQTVSPARLLVMLYERLLRDITQAGEALEAGDLATVNHNLVHAQDIVVELQASLDVSVWSGGQALMDLYQFLTVELVQANMEKDAARIASCRALVAPLVDAWRQAAASVGHDAGGPAEQASA